MIEYLHEVLIKAAQDLNVDAVERIVGLIRAEQAQSVVPARQSSAPAEESPGQYRSRPEWTNVILTLFLPEMQRRGVAEFTVNDLRNWIESHPDLPLNSAERQLVDGCPRWRNQVSSSIQWLVSTGRILKKEGSRRAYLVPAAPSTNGHAPTLLEDLTHV